MRFVAAPWLGALQDGAWLRHAAHANAMARRLATTLERLPNVRLLAPTQANGVFVDLPLPVIDAVRARGWRFYNFVGATGVRFMCAWDTPMDAIDRFAADIKAALPA
jgi:threonine aldolase